MNPYAQRALGFLFIVYGALGGIFGEYVVWQRFGWQGLINPAAQLHAFWYGLTWPFYIGSAPDSAPGGVDSAESLQAESSTSGTPVPSSPCGIDLLAEVGSDSGVPSQDECADGINAVALGTAFERFEPTAKLMSQLRQAAAGVSPANLDRLRAINDRVVALYCTMDAPAGAAIASALITNHGFVYSVQERRAWTSNRFSETRDALEPFWQDYVSSWEKQALAEARDFRIPLPDPDRRARLREILVRQIGRVRNAETLLTSLGLLDELPDECTTFVARLGVALESTNAPLAALSTSILSDFEDDPSLERLDEECTQLWHMGTILNFRGPGHDTNISAEALRRCIESNRLVLVKLDELAPASRLELLAYLVEARLSEVGQRVLCRSYLSEAPENQVQDFPELCGPQEGELSVRDGIRATAVAMAKRSLGMLRDPSERTTILSPAALRTLGL